MALTCFEAIEEIIVESPPVQAMWTFGQPAAGPEEDSVNIGYGQDMCDGQPAGRVPWLSHAGLLSI